jgi:2-keto-3-deoxy-L-rhamnonate aldolase
MSSASAPPPGIYVPVPTFFQPDTAAFPESSFKLATAPLDIQTQIQHSLHLARSGIRGLVLLGSTGEAVHLTRSERSEIITSVRKALSENGFQNYPLVAGTATNSIVETVELLQDAKNDGADYGMVLAPNYFAGALNHKTGLDGIEAWFKAVADASPIPIMV